MLSRRKFFSNSIKTAVGVPLWLRLGRAQALAQMAGIGDYKAIVCVEMAGGNDGNNMLIPYSGNEYKHYADLRGTLAIPQSQLIPLSSGVYSYPLALNPALPNIAAIFNAGHASFVANVGPLRSPATKTQITADPSLAPPSLFTHSAGTVQWQSATTDLVPDSGWGGRIADMMSGQSGSLPMVLNAGENNIFPTGHTVQGITVQGGSIPALAAIPIPLQSAALSLAIQDSASPNELIAHAAQLRVASVQQQLLLAKAQVAGSTLRTSFPGGAFGSALSTIAHLINGRSVIGASRQIFYCEQGSYDTHEFQVGGQAKCLTELDLGLAAFMQALQEMGLSDQVLICTQSDFNRTMQPNTTYGSDHAWGNHQLILGGGMKGGKIIGNLPDMDLGGAQDMTNFGTWIPTLSVTQYAAAVGNWIGLSSAQLATVFPELANFRQGAISLA